MGKIEAGDIRNVAFVGHGNVGKTTLIDALLFHAQAAERKGSVDDGTSILDFDDEEKARKYSIDSAIAHLDWKDKRFQFIDTPGYPDFIGQAISAIANVETVAIVIDAHKGIEVNTRKTFEAAEKAGVARCVILNKLDSDNLDFEDIVRLIEQSFGETCVLFHLPIGIGSKFTGIVDALHVPDEVPQDCLRDPKSQHDALVERIIETDDELLEQYLEGEVPAPEKLAATLTRAFACGAIVPIFCTSARDDIGLGKLLDDLTEFAPAPREGVQRSAVVGDGEVALEPDPAKPFVARVFKTLSDKFGNLTYLRTYQGTIKTNTTVKCARDGSGHRLGQLNLPQGKTLEKIDEVGPGTIVCVAKVDDVQINDTLSAQGDYALPPVVFPKPMFPLAVSAKQRSDDAKIVQLLRRVAHEDPCFELNRDEQTLETVMTGMSQLHLEVVQRRLKNREGVELETHEPKVPYKETIVAAGGSSYRHKKQTGGRGQFAEVHLRLHPRERGEGFEFKNSIVGGVIPSQYIPAVEKGIREIMATGVLAGCEVIDLIAEVHFGKFHDVDSSEAAFKYAASMAFKEAFAQCTPVLLEPIVNIEVVVPGEKMGDITGDLNTRRAHITGMDALPGGLQTVNAQVPLAEVLRYQTELKSLTGGQGSFSMDFSHLDSVPPNVQQQVIEKYRKRKQEASHS